MQKIGDVPGSQASAEGEFLAPTNNHPGTTVKAAWLNTIQRELAAIITGFGGQLNPNHHQQIASLLSQHAPFDVPDTIKGLTPGTHIWFFPEILNPSHTLDIIDKGNGHCEIRENQWLLWRHIWKFNTSDYTSNKRTFSIKPNQTYHLRWRINDFKCYALNDQTYNPQGFPETSPVFDSGYDNMLIAKIQTDQNNHATITPLVNQHHLHIQWDTPPLTTRRAEEDKYYFEFEPQASLTINWARTPYPTISKLAPYNISTRMDVKLLTMPPSNHQYVGTRATRYTLNMYDYLQFGSDETQWTIQATI